MSESKQTCPFCDRPPGSQHNDFCPRSAATMRDLHAKAKIRPIVFWCKGPIVIRFPGKRARVTFNPGIPHVRLDGKKTWKAGGVPIGAQDAVNEFKRSLGIREKK